MVDLGQKKVDLDPPFFMHTTEDQLVQLLYLLLKQTIILSYSSSFQVFHPKVLFTTNIHLIFIRP
ncbi:hypothetical protein JM79_0109 [Gramella sp. Hel_I_59]|nr:hypothetical protein JM79_0109 [Gramella sp. Hel_I_59]